MLLAFEVELLEIMDERSNPLASGCDDVPRSQIEALRIRLSLSDLQVLKKNRTSAR